ncbi:hypothetical protein EJB05_06055 [Eragrostis curvula]|uniref:Bifunctional inhibitor/plant lipid transfer protein/seed storage helical domain-containing protein n=1 Tax=Eragrostis curvula TaxID=38414 RepID=A0A5J9WGV7_9POAL|nr:hypothetical protein EJB05_06055 [Eragrostis curvula]
MDPRRVVLAALLASSFAVVDAPPSSGCDEMSLGAAVAEQCPADAPPSLACCGAVFGAVGAGGFLCLCRVAETPYITTTGVSSDHLLILYKNCGGERADADEFNKCSGSAAESPKETPLPPQPPAFPLLPAQATPTGSMSSKQVPTPTTSSALSPPQAPIKNQDPWYKDLILPAIYCVTGLAGSALDLASDIVKKLLKIVGRVAGAADQDESLASRRQQPPHGARRHAGSGGSARVNPVDPTRVAVLSCCGRVHWLHIPATTPSPRSAGASNGEVARRSDKFVQ